MRKLQLHELRGCFSPGIQVSSNTKTVTTYPDWGRKFAFSKSVLWPNFGTTCNIDKISR